MGDHITFDSNLKAEKKVASKKTKSLNINDLFSKLKP